MAVKKLKKASLTMQLIITMVGIVVGTVLICWFLNSTFLEKYYIYNKESQLQSYFTQVREKEQSLGEDDLEVFYETICSDGNIRMLITDEDNRLVWSSYNSEQRFQMQMENWLFGTDRSKMEVLDSGDYYTLLRQTDEQLNAEYLVLLGSLTDGGNVFMRAAIESIHESAQITNRFFVSISGVAIIISIITIIFLSKNISRPIVSLSDISRRMTNLDFDARYSSGKHVSREIEDLGISMNEMSKTLEQTISELKTANISLQEDIEKKEKIDEMRKEFLSNVSHELKTPLALIGGYAEGLKECINDDESSRDFYCDVIMDETEKMNHIVRQLLELNHLEFGNDPVEMTRFDIVSLSEGVISTTGLMASQKNVDIEMKESDPIYVWGDEFKIEQVLTNYLTNAINHAEGECRVVISFTRHDHLVRASVFNTGQPIPEEEQDKIWIKFYKVDKARTREYGGSGIGLSIVKAIMDSHHRQCGVINHADGVEFWMELESNN